MNKSLEELIIEEFREKFVINVFGFPKVEELEKFILSSLAQYKREIVKEILEKINKANDDNPNVYQDGVIMTPEYQCYLDGIIACVNIVEKVLAELEK